MMLFSSNLEDGATALQGKTERTGKIAIVKQKSKRNIIKDYKIMSMVDKANTVGTIFVKSFKTRVRGIC